jgi:hypothetical protein
MTPNPKPLKVARHSQPENERAADAHAHDLNARVDQLARDLRVQLVRIAQLQAELDLLRKKVG